MSSRGPWVAHGHPQVFTQFSMIPLFQTRPIINCVCIWCVFLALVDTFSAIAQLSFPEAKKRKMKALAIKKMRKALARAKASFRQQANRSNAQPAGGYGFSLWFIVFHRFIDSHCIVLLAHSWCYQSFLHMINETIHYWFVISRLTICCMSSRSN